MLKRKMLRDIKYYKVQFLSIFLMAFLGVFTFTGMSVETSSFEATIDNYYDDTNLADGWIYSNNLVDEFLDYVDHLGATTQMERQLVVDSQAKLDNKPDIRLHFVENNTISKFYLLEGNPLDINDSEGVWLDKSFADARNLKVGDTIAFESDGKEIKKVIRGLGYSPEYVYIANAVSTTPNHNSTGFAYMSHTAFPSKNVPYNVLNVKFTGTPEMYSKILDFRLGGYYTAFLERSNQISVEVVEDSINQQSSVSYVFPPIFIILSMFILFTTMKRVISHQRTHIGILKANGFKNHVISFYYMLPGFLLVTLGSFVGAILGPIIFHIIANPSRIFYFKFPYWTSIDFVNSLIVVFLMGFLSLMVSHFSIEKIINEPPSVIIRPEPPKSASLSFVEKLKNWKKLPFNIRWNFRNIKRNKFQALVTIIGIIGCTVLLISGLGLYEGIENSKEWYFDDINHFESKLIPNDKDNVSSTNSIAQKVDGKPIMESTIEIVKDKTETAHLLVLNDTNLVTMTDDEHQYVVIPEDKVSISRKMAKLMNISVGDTIDCRLLGSEKNFKVKIDQMHSSPYSQGLVMSPHKLNELGLNYTPTGIVTAQHVNNPIDGVDNIIYLEDMISGWEKMEETSMIIIVTLILFAVILAVVILYNLNLLSFIEIRNDLTTLKTLGFESSYLTNIITIQSFLYIIPGFLLGIPIGYFVLLLIIPAFGESMYIVPSISLLNLMITFTVIMSVSVIMIIFFSRKIRNLNIVNSLKNLER